MPTFTQNELADICQGASYVTVNSADTFYNFGVIENYNGLDIDEYMKILRSYSGTSSVDYWDTVPGTDVEPPIDDGDYPDYNIEDGNVVINSGQTENDINGDALTNQDGEGVSGTQDGI